ncbi:MAG: hypothetical protein ACRC14_18240 [Paracoccaceae bacterium]
MRPFLVLALLALAACGADGAPTPPTDAAVTVTGEAAVGVTTGTTP